jgi:hypothetical protein
MGHPRTLYPSSSVESRHVRGKNHKVLPFRAARHMVIDAGRLSARRHITFGLLEFDVTRKRQGRWNSPSFPT